MKKILLLSCIIIFQSHIQASNAFNNDATYYLDGTDDLKPIGMHPQLDDLDVTITTNELIQSVFSGNFNTVKTVLAKKNYTDKEIAQAIYYATLKDFTAITELLSNYAKTNIVTVESQSVDNR